MNCTASTKTGAACKAPAIGFTEFCVMHTSDLARQLGRKGGKSGRGPSAPLKELTPPKTPAGIAFFLAQVLCEVRTGEIGAKNANAIGVVAATALRAFEVQKATKKTLADLLDEVGAPDEAIS